ITILPLSMRFPFGQKSILPYFFLQLAFCQLVFYRYNFGQKGETRHIHITGIFSRFYNVVTSKLFGFYYFTVISFITFIPYALLTIRLPVMYIIPVVGVLVFLISILWFYISFSVKIMQSSKEF